MVGVLNTGTHLSLPPNALLFHTFSVAREKVLPVRHLKIALNSEDLFSYWCYLVCESDNCYQFKTFALLMYSRGVSPRIPSNLIMSQCPHGICLHSLILISQSAARLLVSQPVLSLPGQPISIPSLIRPQPCGLHKPQDMPCSLHSDSDQQKDNINCIQPLASSVCNLNNTQLLASSACHIDNTQLLTSSVCYFDNTWLPASSACYHLLSR